MAQPALAAGPRAALEAKILLRALAYDEALTERVRGELVLAVLAQPGVADSVVEQDDMFAAFAAMEGATVRKMPLRVVKVQFTNADALATFARAENISAVYVTESAAAVAPKVAKIARELQLVTFTRGLANVHQGIALSVAFDGGRPMLVVNLSAARLSGLRLSADLLPIARVIP